VRRAVRFLLGHAERALEQVEPTTTVLEWLRRSEHRTGTKEGCAEGDCGACTVIVARPEAGRLRYEAVDACIRFLPTLDGCQLLTVEDLAQPGTLHPVQAALVGQHGSQCGFCTPGVVMALWALRRSRIEPTPEAIDDALAGNLCRCTGYGPIAAAARVACAAPVEEDAIERREPETLARLEAMADAATLVVGDGAHCFHAPTRLDALCELYAAHPDATILAGGTDVGLWVTKQDRDLGTIIWLGRVEALRRIEERTDVLVIGAGVAWRDALPALAALFPDAGEALRRFGSMQVRNAGTIGGNVANGSPIGDGSPLLLALQATLLLRHGAERRTLPIDAFFLGYGRQDRRPGELLEAISVPRPRSGTLLFARKIAKRMDQDISAVMAAFAIELDDGIVRAARLAFGGLAAIPRRAPAAEAALIGRLWSRGTIEAAMAALADDFQPISDLRASARYRMTVARNLLLACWLEHAGERAPLHAPRAPALA